MSHATPSSFEVELSPMPEHHVVLALDQTYSADEMAHIRRGFVPQAMEEKWFLYVLDDCLFMHRSWTGNLI